jgi:hypothetical protein
MNHDKGLTLPVALLVETYFSGLRRTVRKSVRLVLIFDRGYVRVALIRELNRSGQPFVMRGRKDVIVEAVVRGRRQRISLTAGASLN